ncbi:MAG: class I SAM-dependent methyltransferase [Acidobacteriota bacterium]|nr:class I SAM-dependent methyltransferase [Acidobacteriota bacterium]
MGNLRNSLLTAPVRGEAGFEAGSFTGLPGSTRRVYDLVAGIYPLSTLLFHEKAHKTALSLAEIRDGMRVLEVATGSGEMFGRLVKLNPKGLNCGVDLSPNMAARTQRLARRNLPNVRAHCQAVDACAMPFRDGCFDAVVCCYLLELMGADDILRALAEIHRVLRANGRLTLVLIGQNVPAFNAMYKVAGGLAPAFWGRQVETAIPEAIGACDFEIEHDVKVQQGFYPSRVMVVRK